MNVVKFSEKCATTDCDEHTETETIQETNFDMVKGMNSIELAAWVAIQIKKYYESDNTIIFKEEVENIVNTYLDWFDKPVKIIN